MEKRLEGVRQIPRVLRCLWMPTVCCWALSSFTAYAAEERQPYDVLPRPLTADKLPTFLRPLALYSHNGPERFNGTYRYSIPIDVAPARGGLVPELVLTYDSDRGVTRYGSGWDLPLPYVRRSLRRGSPRYVGPSSTAEREDLLEFRLGDHAGTLVRIKNTAMGVLYRPEVEGVFAKFYYQTAQDRWVVKHPSGKTWTFGGAGRERPGCVGPNTFAWNVERVEDANGNQIDYEYICYNNNLPRLKRIVYDGSSAAPPSSRRPSVGLRWVLNPGRKRWSCRRGYCVSPDWMELSDVRVEAYNERGVLGRRVHRLVHGESPQSAGKRLLAEYQPQSLPSTRFTRAPWPIQFAPGYQKLADGTPTQDRSEERSLSRTESCHPHATGDLVYMRTAMLSDIDGDGDLDHLFVRRLAVARDTANDRFRNRWCYLPPAGAGDYPWYWRQNLGHKWAPAQRMTLPLSCRSFSGGTTRCRPDALSWSTNRFWPGTPNYNYFGSFPIERVTKTFQELMDMNGDGRVDLVYGEHGWTDSHIVVCPGRGDGGFSSCVRWFTFARQDHGFIQRQRTVSGEIPGAQARVYRWDTTSLVDMDGDGLRDYVTAVDGSRDTLEVHTVKPSRVRGLSREVDTYRVSVPPCGHGDYGAETACMASSLSAGKDAETVRCTKRRLVDFNGDGLPDLLTARAEVKERGALDADCVIASEPGLEIRLGRGHAFDEQPRYRIRDTGPTDVSYPKLSHAHTQATKTLSVLQDVNADGLPDLVRPYCKAQTRLPWADLTDAKSGCDEYLMYALRVRLNTGGGFAPDTRWDLFGGGTPLRTAFPALGNTLLGVSNARGNASSLLSGLIDMDGDGRLEFVVVDGAVSSWYPEPVPTDTPWYVVKTQTIGSPPSSDPSDPLNAPPGAITEVASDNGLTTTVAYKRLSVSVLPFPKYAPVAVTKTDRVGGQTRTEQITYSKAQYDLVQQRFAGFGEVETRDAVRRERRYFHQGADRRGIEYKKVTKTPSGEFKRVVERDIVAYYLDGVSRSWARPKTEAVTTYNDGMSRFTQSRRYTYLGQNRVCHPDDRSGCLLRGSKTSAALGLVATDTHNGDRRDRYAYAVVDDDETGKYLVRRSIATREAVPSGETASEKQWLYDDQCAVPSATLHRGRVCRERVWRGDKEMRANTDLSYDRYGRLVGVSRPDEDTETLRYHGATPLVSSRANALGHTQYYRDYHALTGRAGRTCGPQYVSDAERDRCELVTYDLYGRPLKRYRSLPALALVEQVQYQDEFVDGQPPHALATQYPDPLRALGGLPDRQQTSYFNAFGETLAQVRQTPDGYAHTAFAYDAAGRLSAAWRARTEPGGQHRAPVTVADYTYQHDALDRLTLVRNPDGTARHASYFDAFAIVVDENDHVIYYQRNPHGEIQDKYSFTGSGYEWTSLARDAAGRVLTASDGTGAQYAYSYYGDGTLKRAALPFGEWDFWRSWGGRLERVITPDGSSIYLDHDAAGNLTYRGLFSNGKAQTCLQQGMSWSSLSYADAGAPEQLGRLVRVTGGRMGSNDGEFDGSDVHQFGYDYTYDSLGNRSETVLTDVRGGASLRTSVEHDALSEPVATTLTDASRLVHRYDQGGQVSAIQYASHGRGLDAVLVYDPDGRLRELSSDVHDDTASATYVRAHAYDRLGRLRTLVTTVNGRTDSSQAYDYEPNGNLSRAADSQRGYAHAYAYDPANRLVRADMSFGNTEPAQFEYAYNQDGSLQQVVVNEVVADYHYTDQHNLLLDHIAYHDADAGDWERYYHHAPTGSRCGSTPFGHGEAQQTGYLWTVDGKLAQASRRDAATWWRRMEYDHEGNVWKRYDPAGNETIHLGDGQEYDSRQGLTVRVSLPGMRCAWKGAEGAAQCSVSGLRGVEVAYDARGEPVREQRYAPYGTELPTAPSVVAVAALHGFADNAGLHSPAPLAQDPGRTTSVGLPTGDDQPTFGFSDKRRLDRGRLLDFGARPYDPISRQFLSVDPLRLEGAEDAIGLNTLNPFTYTASNPTSYRDPDGRAVETVVDIVSFWLSSGAFGRSFMQAWHNPNLDNVLQAGADFAGAVADGAAMVVPFLATGYGIARHGGRAAAQAAGEVASTGGRVAASAGRAAGTGSGGVDIALGLTRGAHSTPGTLRRFADKVGARPWTDWIEAGLTHGNPGHFASQFRTAAAKAQAIRFNLDGIDNVAAAVRAGSKGFGPENMTNAELFEIAGDAALQAKTVFYRNGLVVPSPF